MRNLPFAASLELVVKRGLFPALLGLLNAGLFVGVAAAEIETTVGSAKEVTTLSTQTHPKRTELAYMVMERHRIGEASIEYRLDRWNWGPVGLQNGGRMVGTLELITEDGTEKIGGKQKTKCESLIWEDERGSFNQRVCWLYWEDLDLDLKPGDFVVWTIKFKKMPRLEYEPFADTVYRDRFTLTGKLHPPF